MSSSSSAAAIDWTLHYNLILKRLFQDLYASTLAKNRDVYAKSTEKIVKPCHRCGNNNRYEHCESCKFAEFVNTTNQADLDRYIHSHLAELTEYVNIKNFKAAHRKALTSKIAEIKGKQAKAAGASSAGKKRSVSELLEGEEQDGEAAELLSLAKRVKRSERV